MTPQQTADWIAVEWDTDILRVWAMDTDGAVLTEATSRWGLAQLDEGEFEPALMDIILPFLSKTRVTPVICSGMVGGLRGWSKTELQSVPCKPAQASAAHVVLPEDPRIAVHILPGVSQDNPPDVMRGEETLIAGVLLDDPDFDGVLVLPGAHTKWVRVSAGEIVSFQTVLTGALIEMLTRHSVLRADLSQDGWDDTAFAGAVRDAMDRPQAMTANLFGIHAASELARLSPVSARARLSGLIVGVELSATKPYWLGQHVAIVGNSDQAQQYKTALSDQGVPAQLLDASGLALKGLTSAYLSLTGKER